MKKSFRLMIMMLTAALLSGCKVKERVVTVVETRTDTLQLLKQTRDSIYIHDSIAVSEKHQGDTLIIEKTLWRIEFRDRAVHDTVYKATHDTIPQSYPVVKEVEREMTWWQKTKMGAGVTFLGLIGLICLIGLIKLSKYIKSKTKIQ